MSPLMTDIAHIHFLSHVNYDTLVVFYIRQSLPVLLLELAENRQSVWLQHMWQHLRMELHEGRHIHLPLFDLWHRPYPRHIQVRLWDLRTSRPFSMFLLSNTFHSLLRTPGH